MTRKEAASIACARGFTNIREWMAANRRAAANFHSRMNKKGEDRGRFQNLIDSLDREHAKFNHL